jgi:hypothetical protein
MDALGETEGVTIGTDNFAKVLFTEHSGDCVTDLNHQIDVMLSGIQHLVCLWQVEERLRQLEEGNTSSLSGKGKGKPEQRAHTPAAKT